MGKQHFCGLQILHYNDNEPPLYKGNSDWLVEKQCVHDGEISD